MRGRIASSRSMSGGAAQAHEQIEEPQSKGEDPDFVIKAALTRFLPDKDMREAFRVDDSPRLRFSDLPATSKLMESFSNAAKLPTDPVYDLPSWLEHNYPQYDASPKSPLYSWIMWMRDNLPRDKQRNMAAFHEYMQSGKFRPAILRQSNYELSRLWDWQHRRAALGLPPRLTPSEQQRLDLRKADPEQEASSLPPVGIKKIDEAATGMIPDKGKSVAPLTSSPTEPPRTSAALPGILGLIQKAEKQHHDFREADLQETAAQGLADLNPEQRAVVSSLRNPGRELRELSVAYGERIRLGKDEVSRERRKGRYSQLLEDELRQRTAAVAEATQMGQDHREVAEAVGLYQKDAGGEGETEDGTKLRKLAVGELKQSVEGHSYWTETRLLDHQANQKKLSSINTELAKSVNMMKRADGKLARGLQDHGYSFSLSEPPPTPTLDQLTSYLQIKYLDVIVQKDEASRLEESLRAHRSGQPGTLSAAASRLSPSEVESLNNQATEAFSSIADSGDATVYCSFLRKLHAEGVISQVELDEGLVAGRVRAMEAQTALRAPTKEDDPKALLAILSGNGDGRPTEDSRAKAVWEGSSSKSGFAAWSKLMRDQARADIAALRASGESVSESQEADLLQWWSRPIPYDEANAIWTSYLGEARMPHGPRLDQVLTQDQLARSSKDGATLSSGSLAEGLKEVYLSYASRHGSPVMPPPSGDNLPAGDETYSNLSWEEVQRLNTALDPMAPASLKALFKAPSLKEVLAQHWRETMRRLVPKGTESSSSSSSDESSGSGSSSDSGSDEAREPPPGLASFEDLWGLMREVYDSTLQSGGEHHPSEKDDLHRLAGFALAASSPLSAESPAPSVGPASEAWQKYTTAQQQDSPLDDVALNPRPYAGARPLIRFKQTFVLGPTASSASTSAASPNLKGPNGAPGSLDTHPDNLGVELRVRVPELRLEVGMTPEGMKHVLAICGKDRFDAATNEIVLSSNRYPSREENRRLCLEQLHLLLREGLPGGQLPVDSAFLRETRVKSKDR